MNGFRFENPNWLWACVPLLLLLAVWFWQRKKFEQRQRALASPALLQVLFPHQSSTRWWIKKWLLWVAGLACLLALSGPQYATRSPLGSRSGVDVIVALDASKSMLATDVQPNRLEKAKAFILRYLEERPSDRVGLVVFAGQAYQQMPLTGDLAATRMYVQTVDPSSVPTPGTNLAAALQKAKEAFPDDNDRYQAILVVTDGEDHTQEATKAAKEIAASGIALEVRGVGTQKGIALVDPLQNDFLKDKSGRNVISALNEPLLNQLAHTAGGRYRRLSNPSQDASELAAQFTQFEKEGSFGPPVRRYASLFYIPLAFALLLLLIEPFIALGRKASWIVLLFFGLGSAQAQGPSELIQKGNVLYRKQQWAEAEAFYHKALEQEPRQPIALFNQANTLYRMNQSQLAIERYDRLLQLEAPLAIQAQAWYNKGLAHIQLNQLPEAIEAFKESLKRNPADTEARENLQKALETQRSKTKEPEPKPNQKNKKPQEAPPMSKEKIAQQLEALRQKEAALQQKMKQPAASKTKPEKDW